jgi:hypothetical protein
LGHTTINTVMACDIWLGKNPVLFCRIMVLLGNDRKIDKQGEKRMLKKIKGLIVAAGFVGVMSLGLNSAEAETTAGWVGIGSDYIDPNGSSNSGVRDNIHSSQGGNIRVDVPSVGFNGTLQMDFFEDDESGNADEFIGTRKVYDGGGIQHLVNVEGYVDGTNDRAEIYVVYTWNFGSSPMTIRFYD